MPAYIAYFRVSTDRQGASGLGLDAQRQVVDQFCGAGTILKEFIEIESGRRNTNRPQLAAALAECRKRRAILVIAKLDRLARNVAFISALMEAGTEFVACDNPQANKLMLHMLAAFAEHEREMISQRTKAALAQAKARGKVLGNPRLHEARIAAAKATRSKPAPAVLEIMRERRSQGDTLRAIAYRLNTLGLVTPQGKPWYASTVRTQLERTA
jgi:DNA invertase Pin-like site-specific DNA recombinase